MSMSNKNSFRRGVVIAASVIALTAFAQSAQADPAPGTCKFAFQHATANTEQAAKQAWIDKVADKFGSKWAQWAGAKAKTIQAVSGGYKATAKPCFYQPVT